MGKEKGREMKEEEKGKGGKEVWEWRERNENVRILNKCMIYTCNIIAGDGVISFNKCF